MGGSIEGLQHVTLVEDENVLYSFTFYEPNLFAWQGDSGSPLMHGLKNIPFPSGPETLAALPKNPRRRTGGVSGRCETPRGRVRCAVLG